MLKSVSEFWTKQQFQNGGGVNHMYNFFLKIIDLFIIEPRLVLLNYNKKNNIITTYVFRIEGDRDLDIASEI